MSDESSTKTHAGFFLNEFNLEGKVKSITADAGDCYTVDVAVDEEKRRHQRSG